MNSKKSNLVELNVTVSIVGFASNIDTNQTHILTLRDLEYLRATSNLEFNATQLKDIHMQDLKLSHNPITRFGQEHDLPDFIRGILSVPAGLWGFGDWIGRRSGLRDWQIGSAVLGDYEKQKAKEEFEYTNDMIMFIIKSDTAREIFFESLQKYMKERPWYFMGRLFTGGIISRIAGGPTKLNKLRGATTSATIVIDSTYGSLLFSAKEIDDLPDRSFSENKYVY
jgi:hypothetical protein